MFRDYRTILVEIDREYLSFDWFGIQEEGKVSSNMSDANASMMTIDCSFDENRSDSELIHSSLRDYVLLFFSFRNQKSQQIKFKNPQKL